MKFYNTPEDDAKFLWNEAKKSDKLAKRMLDAYRKRKRKKKIEKLANDEDHWKGLE